MPRELGLDIRDRVPAAFVHPDDGPAGIAHQARVLYHRSLRKYFNIESADTASETLRGGAAAGLWLLLEAAEKHHRSLRRISEEQILAGFRFLCQDFKVQQIGVPKDLLRRTLRFTFAGLTAPIKVGHTLDDPDASFHFIKAVSKLKKACSVGGDCVESTRVLLVNED